MHFSEHVAVTAALRTIATNLMAFVLQVPVYLMLPTVKTTQEIAVPVLTAFLKIYLKPLYSLPVYIYLQCIFNIDNNLLLYFSNVQFLGV